MTLDTRSLGKNGPVVSALGLGCMAMSEFYGHSDRDEALNTIAAALDAGGSLFDTGDFYGMGDNEILLGEALRGQRDKAFIQVKSGAQRGLDGAFIGLDTRPSVLKNALAHSLKRLKTDHIDLYQVSKDPAVPIEDAVGAIGDLVQQGYVRYVGLTNVDAETVRRGHAAHPLTALQLEYSLMSRDIERTVLPLCRELGIGVTAYGVLSRGLLTGSNGEGDGDVRQRFYSRFQGENLAPIGVLRRHWTKWRRRPASAPRKLRSDGLQAKGRTSFRWWGHAQSSVLVTPSFSATAVFGDPWRYPGCYPGRCRTRRMNYKAKR